MTEPYIGEIRMFGGAFAPKGWEFCNGQLLSISENEALYSLIGSTYGGDRINTFALPDMKGRIPVGQGQGPGLTLRRLGAKFGTESLTLTRDQIPGHDHQVRAFKGESANSADPAGRCFATGIKIVTENQVHVPEPWTAYSSDDPDQALSSESVSTTGRSYSHDNMMPSCCISFIIATRGLYPSRS